MRTVDGFRHDQERVPESTCENRKCRNRFISRPGKKFCSAECRSSADENARQALNRIRSKNPIPETAENVLLRLRSLSAIEQSGINHYDIAQELDELDLLLSRKGPDQPATRDYVRERADAVRLRFEELAHPRNLDALSLYVRALEVLRDVGVSRIGDTPKLLEYGWAAVRFYEEIKDFPKLTRALQAYANTCRLVNRQSEARSNTRRAWHILNEKIRRSNDAGVLAYLHQSALWDLRLSQGSNDIEKKKRIMVDLAEQVNTPTVWLETRRELVGHLTMQWQYDRASEELSKLDELQRNTPNLPTYGLPTLLRPRIELLLALRKTDEAVHLMERRYLPLYHKDPHFHYYKQLRRWKREHKLSIHIPEPTYASPILIYMPRAYSAVA